MRHLSEFATMVYPEALFSLAPHRDLVVLSFLGRSCTLSSQTRVGTPAITPRVILAHLRTFNGTIDCASCNVRCVPRLAWKHLVEAPFLVHGHSARWERQLGPYESIGNSYEGVDASSTIDLRTSEDSASAQCCSLAASHVHFFWA